MAKKSVKTKSANDMTMKKTAVMLAVLILLAAAVVAIGLFAFPYNPNEPPAADSSESSQEGIQTVVDANNKFAFELYSKLDKTAEGNMFYSPYSISAALAMTYEGAGGKTAEEMKEVFHFPDKSILEPNFAAIYNGLNENNNEYQLRTGNALWVQKDFALKADYTSRVENYYGGKAANVDFVDELEMSRQTINSFIAEQTNDKIKDLIPQGMLDPMTRLVLTNAVYFKGTWEWQFDKGDTRESDFRTPTETIKTEMMHMKPEKATFYYADNGKLQILELPYKGDDLSMLILLPKNGQEYDFNTGKVNEYNYTLDNIGLSYENLKTWKSEMKETELDAIYLPKFEFDTKYYMKDALSGLGMPAAFDSQQADFSGMTGDKSLHIGFVIHQAFVKVDEEGTEAAAATAVGMELTSMRQETVFNADHPFIFIIQEKETGNILFMGRVNDPR